jgi:tetratricopeptide (TPR) repeat protein
MVSDKRAQMKKYILIFLILVGGFLPAQAQNDHFPQFMEMANQAYASQKFSLAMDYYNSAIEDKQDGWQAYVGLGNCLYYQKKFKEALKNYERALKINPDNPELNRFVGNLRFKLGMLPTPTPVPVLAPLPGLPPLPLSNSNTLVR